MFKMTLDIVQERLDKELERISDSAIHDLLDEMVKAICEGKPYCYWTGIIAKDDIKMLRKAGYKVRIIAGEWTRGYFDGMIKVRWQKSRRVW